MKNILFPILVLLPLTSVAVEVIPDDVVTQGDVCVGDYCAADEFFGDDTFRIKDYNIRVHFNDASYNDDYPENDWRFTFNDSNNGGENYYSIDDVTNATVPFRIEANSPTGSLKITGDGVEIPNVSGSIDMSSNTHVELSMSNAANQWSMKNNGNTGRFTIKDDTNGTTPLKVYPAAAENLMKLGSPYSDIVKIDGDMYIKASDGGFVSLKDLIDAVEAMRETPLARK